MFFHIRQYLNFSVQENFLLRFFIQVAIVLIAIAFNTENKDTAYCKWCFLRVGEIYISYAVSVKPRKYPRTYGKKSKYYCGKTHTCVFLTHAYCLTLENAY